MNKIADILLTVFSICILLCLFAGALSLVGYIVVLIIGGEMATNICSFIFSSYLPWVIRITSISTGIGLIGMYLSKIKALSLETKEEKTE